MSVGVVLSSRDGGATWTSSTPPAGVADLSGVSCASSSDCMAVGYGSSGGVVVTTTDGGATWTSSTLPAESGLLTAISCSSPSTCMAVGDGNPGRRSHDHRRGDYLDQHVDPEWSQLHLRGLLFLDLSVRGDGQRHRKVGGFLLTYGGERRLSHFRQTGIGWWGQMEACSHLTSRFTDRLGVCISTRQSSECQRPQAATGYWLVAKDGGVFSYGVPFHGSMGGAPLNEPVVGIAATADGGGYYLVAADGGVFTFGDAKFAGSLGGVHLNEPIVGIAVTADNKGYYLVAADGGVFAFGDAVFRGSSFGAPLNSPAVGIALDSSGYGLVHSNGWVSSFASADVSFDPVPLLKHQSSVSRPHRAERASASSPRMVRCSAVKRLSWGRWAASRSTRPWSVSPRRGEARWPVVRRLWADRRPARAHERIQVLIGAVVIGSPIAEASRNTKSENVSGSPEPLW